MERTVEVVQAEGLALLEQPCSCVWETRYSRHGDHTRRKYGKCPRCTRISELGDEVYALKRAAERPAQVS